MLMYNDKVEKFLSRFGWSRDRKVEVPEYLIRLGASKNTLSIFQNIYGMECVSESGYSRKFTVPEAYVRDFENDMNDLTEGTGLEDVNFFPLGVMEESGGILVLDEYGKYFLASDDMVYYGKIFEQFSDVVFFNVRTGLSIRDNLQTYYCFNNKNTGVLFDAKHGWKSDEDKLNIEYLKNLCN